MSEDGQMFGKKKRLWAAIAGTMMVAAPASAQLYFRPFFRPFAYTYEYSPEAYPVERDEAPARYGSRRAVASILAREGFRLVGPLGRRGEQIVATGSSRRNGDMRFIVDPYEGRIIRGTRIAPPDDDTGPRRDDEPEYVLPLGGSRPVVRELDREDPPRASRPRSERSARLREAPDREWVTIDGQKEPMTAPRRITPEAPAAKPESAKRPEPKPVDTRPVETQAREPKPQQARQEPPTVKPAGDPAPESAAAKPAPRIVYPAPVPETEPVPAKPAKIEPAKVEPAKAAPTKVEPAKAEPNTTVFAKPAPAASTPPSARAATPTPKTAADVGGSGRRAIVPPTTGPATSASTNGAN